MKGLRRNRSSIEFLQPVPASQFILKILPVRTKHHFKLKTLNAKPLTKTPIPYFCGSNYRPVATKYSKETYLYWYELMQLIRQFESMAEEKYKREGKIRGFFHAYVGQEAIAGGCMTATKPEDSFITGYRDH